jgi:hypothetical protein
MWNAECEMRNETARNGETGNRRNGETGTRGSKRDFEVRIANYEFNTTRRGVRIAERTHSDMTRCCCVLGCSLLCFPLTHDTKTPPEGPTAVGPADRGEEHGH